MKRLYYSILFAAISILISNCQKEISYVNFGSNDKITATLQGNILDESGQPAAGVNVKAGTKTTTTNSKGYFRIDKAALDKKASLVTAEKSGYFKAYRTFCATSGTNQVMIKLIRKNLTGAFNSMSGGEVTLSNGSKISLPLNAIVSATGNSYNGMVNVYSTYIDPTASDISETIPGSLMADDKNNNRVVLTSYGMIAVELQSSAGEKLQIASGALATLTIPIPLSIQSSAPTSISLWYVDEQTGIWKEEGTAIKAGNNYVGQVKHFSFWNCDYGGPAVLLSMTLRTSNGNPLVNAPVRLTRPDGSSSCGWTDSLGQVSGLVPPNENLLMEVLAYPCYTRIYSQNIGPFVQNTNIGIITINNSSSGGIVMIQGRLLNCAGTPLTNGHAIIYYDNQVHYAATNNNGDFSTNFTFCTGSPATCDILGVDNTAQQQGVLSTITIIAPITSAGNISACGTSANEFINYTLDGTNYTITSAGNDSVRSYTYAIQGTYPYYTYLGGDHYPDRITFGYGHNATAGTFPLSALTVQSYDSLTNFIQPFNIHITNYPQVVGQFYEGNFNGQFTHYSSGATIHNINCTFRVRK